MAVVAENINFVKTSFLFVLCHQSYIYVVSSKYSVTSHIIQSTFEPCIYGRSMQKYTLHILGPNAEKVHWYAG